ncbi:MAG: rhodanese-like domain-containing protein [Flavobacteriales bacterium]|nr:rhodanese-like domain-containing protein [Flavobacteriales bacterium]
MLRSLLPIATLTIALLSTGCSNAQAPTEVTPQEFAALADKDNFILLDVRTPEEWNAGRMKDAVHIDWYADDFTARVSKLDKSKPVLVYCASGGRSSEAQDAMRDLGFKQVVNLDGGMKAWRAAGLPVVK